MALKKITTAAGYDGYIETSNIIVVVPHNVNLAAMAPSSTVEKAKADIYVIGQDKPITVNMPCDDLIKELTS